MTTDEAAAHPPAEPRKRSRRWLVIAVVVPLLFFLIAFTGFGIWVGGAAQPMPEALAALQSDAVVRVEQAEAGWWVFTPGEAAPGDAPPDTGLIFYPGGLVDARAYAPMARRIAEAGYVVVIPTMPLNLAVLDYAAAARVLEAYPDITSWAIGGHSLGGSMAARFAYDNPFALQGLVLVASYPDRDLSGRLLAVTSIYGSSDGLATPAQVENSAAQLPVDTVFVRIEGGNHAQFGYYGEQARDNPATISREAQHDVLVQSVLALLARIAPETAEDAAFPAPTEAALETTVAP
jgi:dienelactone hydrolase